jgi:RND family efflux transporter MFP subunit
MRLPRKRPLLITAAVLAVGIPGFMIFTGGPTATDNAIVVSATRGPFTVTVATSGELRAREAVQITAPGNAQQAGAFQMRIQSLVPEGTLVNRGDVVAELDRSTLATRLQDLTLNLQRAEAQLEQAMLDSALTLSTARESIRGFELQLEERRLAREQAVYEAPTVRRQAEIEHQRTERALAQSRLDYGTRTEQAQARMREVGADVARQRNQLSTVQQVMAGFTITAPASGMVIYVREWNGRKRTAGSQIGAWDPAVATLPDLSQMESVTYINEIDVRRVTVGQAVAVSLDADPARKLTGTVSMVANVGEQRPNTDAKVFEVRIALADADTTLRPGMTTGNTIGTLSLPEALFVPLEALHNDGAVAFVYRQDGGRVHRQEVRTGAVNENHIVILEGLGDDARVLLSPPTNGLDLELVRLPTSATPPATGGDTAVHRS